MRAVMSFFILLLLISFASVNAVLFTPALPEIASYFAISDNAAQQTITWFLVGYAIGQLLYGPIANRFGRKPALYMGILLQIVSSLLCVFAGSLHVYSLLVLGRFFLALGSGVGLKMTFTLVNEMYEPQLASQKIAYLMIAFAITPGLSVMIGGLLCTHYGWTSTFYAGAVYGIVMLLLTMRLPETKLQVDKNALKLRHLIHGYLSQFKNIPLISAGLLMGSGTSFVYLFAALAPFIAMNIMHMDITAYGTANLFPAIGLIVGSISSAQLIKKYSYQSIMLIGILFALLGSIMMSVFMLMQLSAYIALFLPMIICYFGLSLVMANASSIAMSKTSDKAHGSAVMSFTNMGLATAVVLGVGMLPINLLLLPIVFIVVSVGMIMLYSAVVHPSHLKFH
jgi:DHA1 family bicyclomycin/chloramphenicol resistance-like MFS transporter